MQRDMDFDGRAEKYDGRMGKTSQRFYKMLLGQIETKPGDTVLDAGCGTGEVLKRLAESREIDGYGVDISESMVTRAKRKNPGMKIQVARSEDTPFEDDFFDVVFVCMAYHHFSDKDGFASEAKRILKPRGRLYIADPYFPAAVRAAVNVFFRLMRVAGAIYAPQKIHEDFAAKGFTPDGFIKNGYAQLVMLKK